MSLNKICADSMSFVIGEFSAHYQLNVFSKRIGPLKTLSGLVRSQKYERVFHFLRWSPGLMEICCYFKQEVNGKCFDLKMVIYDNDSQLISY